MAIRVYKPTSPARRFMSVLTFEEVTKKTPERSLVTDLRHKAGRNNPGQDHRPSSGRRRSPQVPHHRLQARSRTASPPTSAAIEYDPNRTCFIALLYYADGEKRYILAPLGLKVGDTVMSGPDRRHQARQLPAHREHPPGHPDPQRGDQARPAAARWSAPPAPPPS